MPLVLAELEIPFKDKLVTEKIQQRRHASTLLSVQTLQAQGEILGSSEWFPQLRARKTPSWTGRPQTEAEPPVAAAVRKPGGRRPSSQSLLSPLRVTLKEAAERRGCSGISLCISSYRTGQSSRQESEFINLLHLNS